MCGRVYRVSGFFLLMVRRPPRSTLDRSAAASDVYKRQHHGGGVQRVGRRVQRRLRGYECHEIVGHAFVHEHARRRVAAFALVEAVSYTHLRVHETVLDLVCRLLLEKKKKTYILQGRTQYTRRHIVAIHTRYYIHDYRQPLTPLTL